MFYLWADLECFNQVDVCFVLDSSTSICGSNSASGSCNNWALLLSFMNDIIDAFSVGDQKARIGLVTFSSDAILTISLDQYPESGKLKEAMQLVKYIGGETNTGKALHVTRKQCFARSRGEREGLPNIAVIITDGLPTRADFDMDTEATLLRQISTVLAVGITENVEKQLLRDISSFPQIENENFFSSPDFSSLSDILKTLVVKTCQAPLRSSFSPISGNFSCELKHLVPVPQSDFSVVFSSASSENPSDVNCFVDLQCFRQADVCFVIDSSGSICESNSIGSSCDNWFLLLSFVNTIIDAFTIGEQQTRVGVVTFSNDATLTFPMNRYFNGQELKDAVSSISHVGGQTNTGKALHVVRTQCFNSNNGERSGVPNIAVAITDGLPTIIEYNMKKEASLLKQQSKVLAVGISRNVEKTLLRDISSAPQRENENYFSTPDFASLSNIMGALVVETCEATKVTQSPIITGIRFQKQGHFTICVPIRTDCRVS